MNEGIIRFISNKKHESEWLLEWRLKAYRHWTALQEPTRQKAEVKVMFDQVSDMLITGHSDVNLGKLSTLAGVLRLPVRIKCAIPPWLALADAVGGRSETISTESDQEQP